MFPELQATDPGRRRAEPHRPPCGVQCGDPVSRLWPWLRHGAAFFGVCADMSLKFSQEFSKARGRLALTDPINQTCRTLTCRLSPVFMNEIMDSDWRLSINASWTMAPYLQHFWCQLNLCLVLYLLYEIRTSGGCLWYVRHKDIIIQVIRLRL